MDKVVACMQQYSTDGTDADIPYDTEDGVISWMNKVVRLRKSFLLLCLTKPDWFVRKNKMTYIVSSFSGLLIPRKFL